MFYRYALPIPKSTAEGSPVELVCELTHGVVTHVWVGFPRGCAGLARVSIYEGVHQVWPTNSEEHFAWDDFVYDFEERFELYTAPYELVIKGWNEDELYAHEVMVCFELFTTPIPWLTDLIQSIFGRGG